jgi:putative glutamine amidotransferase
VRVAVAPGAMLPVLTVPLGVSTDSAWVIAPVFLTVIVTLPVWPSVGAAGRILNSFSLRVSASPAPAPDELAELLAVVLGAAAEDELAVVEELLLEEPQPARAAATAIGASRTGARITTHCAPFASAGEEKLVPERTIGWLVMRTSRPAIGICTALERANYGVWDQPAALAPFTYIAAIQRAGGLAMMIPPDEVLVTHPEEMLDRIDGLILAGGADIDPSFYGAEPHPETRHTVPARDRTEIAIALGAIERDLPVLGICRGMQLLNVALGGTLHQHLPELFGHEEHRRQLGTFDGAEHDVRLEPGSLAALAAGEVVHVTKSHHHQGVDVIGDGLRVTGHSTLDDLVEAIELPDKGFVLGVQWHPEADKKSRVVRALVERADQSRATMASISTLAPRGSAATPMATRAGGSVSKNEP